MDASDLIKTGCMILRGGRRPHMVSGLREMLENDRGASACSSGRRLGLSYLGLQNS